jgi:O-antigen/teichoic acid export membrane protein
MKLALVVLLLDRVLNSILLPLLARMHGSRSEEFSEFVKLVFKGVFAVIFPAALSCGILAPWLVGLVFGEGYSEAVPHLRFLLIYVVLTLLNSVFMCSMLAAGEELLYSRLLLTGSIILAGLVFLLTLLLGPIGTGLGVGLGEMVIFGILLVTTRRILHTDLSLVVVRFTVAAGVTLGTMALIPISDPVSLILLSVVVYVSALFLTGAISVREVRVLVGKIV